MPVLALVTSQGWQTWLCHLYLSNQYNHHCQPQCSWTAGNLWRNAWYERWHSRIRSCDSPRRCKNLWQGDWAHTRGTLPKFQVRDWPTESLRNHWPHWPKGTSYLHTSIKNPISCLWVNPRDLWQITAKENHQRVQLHLQFSNLASVETPHHRLRSTEQTNSTLSLAHNPLGSSTSQGERGCFISYVDVANRFWTMNVNPADQYKLSIGNRQYTWNRCQLGYFSTRHSVMQQLVDDMVSFMWIWYWS